MSLTSSNLRRKHIAIRLGDTNATHPMHRALQTRSTSSDLGAGIAQSELLPYHADWKALRSFPAGIVRTHRWGPASSLPHARLQCTYDAYPLVKVCVKCHTAESSASRAFSASRYRPNFMQHRANMYRLCADVQPVASQDINREHCKFCDTIILLRISVIHTSQNLVSWVGLITPKIAYSKKVSIALQH